MTEKKETVPLQNTGAHLPSVINPVPTAIPVFIGYTEKAGDPGNPLLYVPTLIRSMEEYRALFGGPLYAAYPVFDLNTNSSQPPDPYETGFGINGINWHLKYKMNHEAYCYPALQLFYLNGGGDCYILSAGTYKELVTKGVCKDNYLTDNPAQNTRNVFTILANEMEPTLILAPDLVAAPAADGDEVNRRILEHCAATGRCFAIFNTRLRSHYQTMDDVITAFGSGIGDTGLMFGALYYPWLNTNIAGLTDLNFTVISNYKAVLTQLAGNMPETEQSEVLKLLSQLPDPVAASPAAIAPDLAVSPQFIHQQLLACSEIYSQFFSNILSRINQLPPAGAIAGIYAGVDTQAGVWKAPANVSLNAVTTLTDNLTQEETSKYLVPLNGKSANSILAAVQYGTVVWGARTLAGNNLDFRYISVRRTVTFIEQSVKQALNACRTIPNTAPNWAALKTLIESFLSSLWNAGGLAGSTAEEAFSVNIGLGSTMTPDDIFNNVLRLTLLVAITHPAEFIEMTVEQQLDNTDN